MAATSVSSSREARLVGPPRRRDQLERIREKIDFAGDAVALSALALQQAAFLCLPSPLAIGRRAWLKAVLGEGADWRLSNASINPPSSTSRLCSLTTAAATPQSGSKREAYPSMANPLHKNPACSVLPQSSPREALTCG
ncbi:hypothetical protein cyc_05131 [Cyclospora cayetanensis]|uniref:Uncharacterized protein n=1 Tax=Cyclospora cayetanensis TaxID=88456 RepID=A0A1D3CYD8_9EIME|nr:hypothetical protein cyc_05131 [Cyclospora cayetanensis]